MWRKVHRPRSKTKIERVCVRPVRSVLAVPSDFVEASPGTVDESQRAQTMPRNGNIIVVESVVSPEGSNVMGKAADVEEDLASAIKENLKLKSHQQPCHVCGQQRHPRYSPYFVPRRSESSGTLSAVTKDGSRKTCAAGHHHQPEDPDKDPYELLQELLQQGTLIQEAVRRLQGNVVGKKKTPHSLDSSSRDSFSF